jgi:sugar phosphate isomerase/epimerase
MEMNPTALQLSQTTIYRQDSGCPQQALRAIAEAGFTHLHWSHHWSTDFLYAQSEIAQILRWLKDYGLTVLDVHASAGREKRWDAPEEYRRLAGVALVCNRLEFAARLGVEAVVLHAEPDMPLEAQLRSLHELEPYARMFEVRIAAENFGNPDSHTRLERLFGEFSPDLLAFCYDTGHGNQNASGLAFLEAWSDRLAVIHVHDNDGTGDHHKLPFTGSVDWRRFLQLLSASAYKGPINLECTMGNHNGMSDQDFLQAAYQAGRRLEALRSA